MRLRESDGQRLYSLCEEVQSMRTDLEQHIWDFDDGECMVDYDYGRKCAFEAASKLR
jgi:hypothetical protein